MKLLRKFIIFALGAASLSTLSACNKSSDDDEDEAIPSSVGAYSSTLVSSFSIKANYKILANLDSVFFSIDQVSAQIYNADSLPCGTDVRKLVVNIGTPSTCSAAQLIFPSRFTGQDTVVDYLKNPTDSINFSKGPVMLRITASNGDDERSYQVKVNVHALKADSLQWTVEQQALPGSLAATAQHSVEFNGKYFSLATAAGRAELSVAENPLVGPWETTPIELPTAADVNTLRASADYLYLLANGRLWRSEDGLTWADTGSFGWTWLYGAVGEQLVGVNNGKWLTYPGNVTGDIPAEMPVSETSLLWSYSDAWFITPQAIMLGGVKADGSLSDSAWGFDGTAWMRLNGNVRSLPAARGWTLFPYFTYRTPGDKFFAAATLPCWIAMGGIRGNGTLQPDVYYSLDNGVNWLKAPENMQLPEGLTIGRSASVLIYDKEYTASRAIKPVSSWDCPYIVIQGGYGTQGSLLKRQAIGVINHLMFKPLQ